MSDRFCTFCGTQHPPLTACPTRSDLMPAEIVEAVARRLYECERGRADFTDEVIAKARGKDEVQYTMEPWDECSDVFIGDAKAAINAFLVASAPAEQSA